MRFEGSLRLAGDRTDGLETVATVDGERITLMAGPHVIGDWNLRDATIVEQNDGFHLSIEGEEIILILRDPAAFADALAGARPPSWEESSRNRLRKVLAKEKAEAEERNRPEPVSSPPADDPSKDGVNSLFERLRVWFLDLPGNSRLIGGGAIAFVLLMVVAPLVIGWFTLLAGGVLVIAGMLATTDPILAARMPIPWEPTTMMAVGGGLMVIGVLPLAFFG